ncbi:MAG: nucleotidyltransferase family protein [Vicinamibacterales bacterium]
MGSVGVSTAWPTAEQTLLLQAALLDGDRARDAFRRWKTAAWTQRLDAGSRRLLPLLQLNLRALGMREAEHERLVAAAARATDENAKLLEAVTSVVGAFHAAGIDCVLLKGMALALQYYPAAAARPMGDCDLLVRPTEAVRAGDVLARLAWTPAYTLSGPVLRTVHAASYQAPSGMRLDLHWHVSPEDHTPNASGDHWAAVDPIDVGGHRAWMLCPADMLLHVCVHGMRWSTTPTLRWAADALTIVRSDRPVAWDRFVDRATRQQVTLPAGDALRFLREALDAPVPDDVLPRLLRVRVSQSQRLEYRVKRQQRTAARLILIHWFQHRRVSGGAFITDLVRFPGYLRRIWGLRPRSR